MERRGERDATRMRSNASPLRCDVCIVRRVLRSRKRSTGKDRHGKIDINATADAKGTDAKRESRENATNEQTDTRKKKRIDFRPWTRVFNRLPCSASRRSRRRDAHHLCDVLDHLHPRVVPHPSATTVPGRGVPTFAHTRSATRVLCSPPPLPLRTVAAVPTLLPFCRFPSCVI